MGQQNPLMVAGGGIGGLSAALALARAGQSVRIIEQASEFRAIGYGIQLGPNAHHAFRHLGIEREVLERSSLPEAGVLANAVTGETLMRLPMGEEMRKRYGQPYAVIHRPDLHEVLIEACRREGVELVTDCELHSFHDAESAVRIETSKGPMEAAALIAADGIWSKSRTTLVGAETPERLGYVAFRAVRPMSEIPAHLARNEVKLWCGPACHMIHYPLHGGTIFNLVIGFDYRYNAEAEAGMSYKERILKRFEGACEDVRGLLPYLDFSRFWEISTISPISTWSSGRVTLLGDSAHAMVQAMAQGACQAVEDALVIAECVASADGDYAAAFREFNARRLVRATRVQYMSRFMWELIHVRGAYVDLRQDLLSRYRDQDTLEMLSWLYDEHAAGLGRAELPHLARVG
jgi:salicylate hydroxylase